MAQSGYTPILIYASGTATNVPLAANMTSTATGAELAINYADGKLYYKNSSNVVTLLASTSGASGDVVGPASATDNALARFDLTTGKLIQNSVGILSDAGILTGLTGLTSSGPITLSSLTSGRVTYAGASGLLSDSANLKFDGTNLGIGGTISSWNTFTGSLQIDGASLSGLGANNTALASNAYYQSAWKYYGTGSAALYQQNAGQHTWQYAGAGTAGNAITFSTAMLINGSGQVGIGTSSPSDLLTVQGTIRTTDGTNYAQFANNFLRTYASGTFYFDEAVVGQSFVWRTSSASSLDTTALTLTSSGNLGLGVTPSAWSGGLLGLQVKDGTMLAYAGTSGYIGANAYYSTSGGTGFKYYGTGVASLYAQESGIHKFFNAPSGTAGNAITFTQAMTLDASGRLGIGTSSPSSLLHLSSSSSTGQTITSVGTNVYSSVSFFNTTTGYGYDIGFGGSASVAPNSFYIYGGSSTGVKLVVDASGNVGIGTSSPNVIASGQTHLDVRSSSFGFVEIGTTATATSSEVGYLEFMNGNNVRLATVFGGADGASNKGYLGFQTAIGGSFTERMRIDSSGNLLVGSTSNAFSSRLVVQGTAGTNTPDVTIGIPVNAAGNTCLTIARSAATSGYIQLETFQAGVTGCNLVINAANAGNVLVGTTGNTFGAKLVVVPAYAQTGASFEASNSNYPGIATWNNQGNYPAKQIAFHIGTSSPTEVGTITSTASTTSYNTSSDYRLKENITPMTGALAKVAQLKPVTYKWKADGSDGQGFIAHELQAVIPDCVTGKKDAVDENGKPKYQGVDTSFLVATLVSAIQEQQALIESLTTRLTALENK